MTTKGKRQRENCSDGKLLSLPTLRLWVRVTNGAKVGALEGGVKKKSITTNEVNEMKSNLSEEFH